MLVLRWLRQLQRHRFPRRALRRAPVCRRVRPVHGLGKVERVGLRPWRRLEAFLSAASRSPRAG